MINIKSILYLMVMFSITTTNAKVLEVSQLFNKSMTKVKQVNIGLTQNYYGNVQINEENTVDIVTRYDGFITKLNANKTYMPVKKGDILLSIYSDKVLSIQEELKVTQKINKKLYKSTLDKLSALGLDNRELERIKSADKSLESINIYSPIDAMIMKKNVNNQSAVKKGQTILELVNLENIWFIAKIYQKEISSVTLGMNAKIYLEGIDNPIKSKIDYIYPLVDKDTKTVQVRFIIDNKKMNIYPNMFGEVKLQTNKRTMLTLPKTAVLNKGSKFYVFKPISNKEFEPIQIEARRISSNTYEIIDGLQVNDEVINNALFLLDSDAITNALYEEDDDDW